MGWLAILLCSLLLLHALSCANAPPPRLTKYNSTLSETLLHLCAGAYGDRKADCVKRAFPAREQRALYQSINKQCDIVESSCESFIVISKTVPEAVIVFRGTKKKKQLLLESWATLQEGVGFNAMGKVNRYFSNALGALWKPIADFLNDPAYANHSIIFTGHSLGGALASLAAAQTVKIGLRKHDNVKVYTFGQPRTGSLQYARSYDALGIETYRVVYGVDMIPHNPSCEKDPNVPRNKEGASACSTEELDGMYHHGTEIWYPINMTRNAFYFECIGAPKNEDFNCSNMMAFTMDNKEQYMWDHRHYFDVSLANYGKSGCTNRTKKPLPKKSLLSKLMNTLGAWLH